MTQNANESKVYFLSFSKKPSTTKAFISIGMVKKRPYSLSTGKFERYHLLGIAELIFSLFVGFAESSFECCLITWQLWIENWF